MTNRQNIITILRAPAIASDDQIVKYVPCPYTCADKNAPCADIAPEMVSTSFCAACLREWLKKPVRG